jgi:type II secretory pathway pseudopilin PulG
MQKQNSYLSYFGFTVLELLLLVSVMGILATIGAPHLFGSLEKKRLQTERDKIVSTLKAAQQQSRVAQDGRSYGVRFSPYRISTIPDNQSVTLDSGVKLAHFDSPTIFFEKISGLSRVENSSNSLELVLDSHSFVTRVTVNAYGVIEVAPVEKK